MVFEKAYKVLLLVVVILSICFVGAVTTISDEEIYTTGSLNVSDGRLIMNSSDTIFTGEVQNIDDINGISRFSETNINNGSLSIAAFSATNDVGDIMWMGISGSNFNVSVDENQSRIGALFLDSPMQMYYMIGFDQGYVWRNNKCRQFSSL